MHLIQITEKIPPSMHGIGDYAYNLACKIREIYNTSTSFVTLDTVRENQITQTFPVYSLSDLKITLADSLINLVEVNQHQKNVIILHFDRGIYDIYKNKKLYEMYGLPINLFKTLKKVKKTHSNLILGVVFHEFLSQKIERRRDYLLRPLQNAFMRSIIKLADFSICSNPVIAKQIFALHAQAKIFIQPVPSNIGDDNNVISSKKDGSWVIFGSTDNIIKNLRKFIEHLPLIKQKQDVTTLNIIGGKKSHYVIDLIDNIKQSDLGINYYPEIQNQEAKNIFLISKFCYMYYFHYDVVEYPALIFKSGVFAAACSCGAIPVFGHTGMADAIGIFKHPGFVFLENDQFNFPSEKELNELAKQLSHWYQKYSSSSNMVKNLFEFLETFTNSSIQKSTLLI